MTEIADPATELSCRSGKNTRLPCLRRRFTMNCMAVRQISQTNSPLHQTTCRTSGASPPRPVLIRNQQLAPADGQCPQLLPSRRIQERRTTELWNGCLDPNRLKKIYKTECIGRGLSQSRGRKHNQLIIMEFGPGQLSLDDFLVMIRQLPRNNCNLNFLRKFCPLLRSVLQSLRVMLSLIGLSSIDTCSP